jgi:hypothetical protein
MCGDAPRGEQVSEAAGGRFVLHIVFEQVNNYIKMALKENYALPKENLLLLAVGLVIIIIGCICMIGGGSKDGVSYNPEIFSSMRITVAPIILVIGFFFEIFAIVWLRVGKGVELSGERTFSDDEYDSPESEGAARKSLPRGGKKEKNVVKK